MGPEIPNCFPHGSDAPKVAPKIVAKRVLNGFQSLLGELFALPPYLCPFFAPLGRVLEGSGELLDASWGALGGVWGAPGACLELSREPLGHPGVRFDSS